MKNNLASLNHLLNASSKIVVETCFDRVFYTRLDTSSQVISNTNLHNVKEVFKKKQLHNIHNCFVYEGNKGIS